MRQPSIKQFLGITYSNSGDIVGDHRLLSSVKGNIGQWPMLVNKANIDQ